MDAPSTGLESFFSSAAGVSGTLWGISLAILTIVLSRSAIGFELGTLGALMRQTLEIAPREDLDPQKARAIKGMVVAYRAIWLLTDLMPIPIFFGIATIVSLLALLPGVPSSAIAAVIVCNVFLYGFAIEGGKKIAGYFENLVAQTGASSTESEGLPKVELRRYTAQVIGAELIIFLESAIQFYFANAFASAIVVVSLITFGIFWSMRVSYYVATAIES